MRKAGESRGVCGVHSALLHAHWCMPTTYVRMTPCVVPSLGQAVHAMPAAGPGSAC